MKIMKENNPSYCPILYTFRRCPFAIRARLAIYFSKIKVEIREVSLSSKPSEMLKISTKGTVPVLHNNDCIIDESLDVMYWALDKSDHKDLLKPYKEDKRFVESFINEYDTDFKNNLDKYKYSSRYKNNENFFGKIYHRDIAFTILLKLNKQLKLKDSLYIYKESLSILDISIVPFVRQFRIADTIWFDNNDKIFYVKRWLNNILNSNFFSSVMHKYKIWDRGSEKIYFHS